MDTPERREKNKRLRAAWGYSGLTYKELAEASGVDVEHLRTYLERRKPSLPTDDATLYAIVEACGVPRAFIDTGFAALERPLTDVEKRLYELERKVDEGLGTTPPRLGSRLKPVQAKDGAEPGAAQVRPSASQRRGGSRPRDQDAPRTQPGSQ